MKLYNSKEYLTEQLKEKGYLQIAKECKISKTTVQRKLKQFNLTKSRISWTKKEILLLKKHYCNDENAHALFPNKTKSAIYHFAHKLKLTRPLRKRYNKVNENFFKKWTKKSSYVLGWMFSDGNVSKDGRTFGFHLNKKDINIIKKIKRAIESEQNFFIRGNDVEFKVHSKKMCRDLVSLGCGPRKTLKVRFPKNMPQKYISHFIRGYFDGDGSIHFNYPNVIKIKIVGNKRFIDQLRNIIAKTVKIEISKTKKGVGNVWSIEIYGDRARKFCQWMYKDCDNLYLERKYKRYKKHLQKRLIK